MQLLKPPTPLPEKLDFRTSIFLAGSIEEGKAIPWHDDLCAIAEPFNVAIFNPRRDSWDSSWVQDISNEQFSIQVNWEMDALERADYIIVNFDPATKSPITLLELGLHAKSGKLIICCPDGFWRKGNVQIVAQRNGIHIYETFEELKVAFTELLQAVLK